MWAQRNWEVGFTEIWVFLRWEWLIHESGARREVKDIDRRLTVMLSSGVRWGKGSLKELIEAGLNLRDYSEERSNGIYLLVCHIIYHYIHWVWFVFLQWNVHVMKQDFFSLFFLFCNSMHPKQCLVYGRHLLIIYYINWSIIQVRWWWRWWEMPDSVFWRWIWQDLLTDWMWGVREGEETRITPKILAWATERMALPFAEMGKTIRGMAFRVWISRDQIRIPNLRYPLDIK